MDVVFHIGAHRTASTSFQHYMRHNADGLATQGVGFWGPLRTRNGLFDGIMPGIGPKSPEAQFDRARGRLALRMAAAEKSGIRTLVVSEENIMGSPRQNLRDERLYPHVAERVARHLEAFGGRVGRIVLSLRSQDTYWASALAFAVGRGHQVPDADDLDKLVTQPRHWRDVVRDVADAAGDVPVEVSLYEEIGGAHDLRLMRMTGSDAPKAEARVWRNQSPDLASLRAVLAAQGRQVEALPKGEGRWQPFDTSQKAALREMYLDDIFWLRSQTDGQITLTEETGPEMTGTNPAHGQMTRGQSHGFKERRMA